MFRNRSDSLSKDFKTLILDATADLTSEPDWDMFMRIADQISAMATSEPQQLIDTVKFIRKRISSKKWRIVFIALQLVDCAIKNCDDKVKKAFGTVKFVKVLKNVEKDTRKLSSRDAREARDKLLQLVQLWGEAFLPKKTTPEFGRFVQLYTELRLMGVKFPTPQMDETAAPVFTPAVHIPPDIDEHKSAPAAPSGPGLGAIEIPQLSTPLPGDLAMLPSLLEILPAMLISTESKDDLHRNTDIRDMVHTVKVLQPKLVEFTMSASSSHPEAVTSLFALNEAAQSVVNEYEYMLAHGPRIATPVAAAPAPAPAPVAATPDSRKPAPVAVGAVAQTGVPGDLNDFFSAAPAPAAPAPAAPSTTPARARASVGPTGTFRAVVAGEPESPMVPALAPPRSSEPRQGRRRSRTGSSSSPVLDLFGNPPSTQPQTTAPVAPTTGAVGAVAVADPFASAPGPAHTAAPVMLKTGNPAGNDFNPFAKPAEAPAPAAPSASFNPFGPATGAPAPAAAPAAAPVAAASFNPFAATTAAPTAVAPPPVPNNPVTAPAATFNPFAAMATSAPAAPVHDPFAAAPIAAPAATATVASSPAPAATPAPAPATIDPFAMFN